MLLSQREGHLGLEGLCVGWGGGVVVRGANMSGQGERRCRPSEGSEMGMK